MELEKEHLESSVIYTNSVTRMFVPKSYVENYFRSSSKVKVFEVCPSKKGICPYIVVGGDQILIGGWKYLVEEDDVTYFMTRPHRLFKNFLRILDEKR